MPNVSNEIYSTVKPVMDKYGIPEKVWMPIMLTESEGNPKNKYITAKEQSYGLFQINRLAHPTFTVEQLIDPATNAEIAARDFISPAMKTLGVTGENVTAQQVKSIYTGLKNPDTNYHDFIKEGGIRPDWSLANTRNKFQSYLDPYFSGGPAPSGVQTTGGLTNTALHPPNNLGEFLFPWTSQAQDGTNPSIDLGFWGKIWYSALIPIIFIAMLIAFFQLMKEVPAVNETAAGIKSAAETIKSTTTRLAAAAATEGVSEVARKGGTKK